MRKNEAWNLFWFCLVVIVFVGTLAVAGGIQSQGRDLANHTGPIPPNVRQIDDDELLVSANMTHINLMQLCGGDVFEINPAGGSMMDIKCDTNEVTWNSHGPREGSYSGALASMFTSVAYWVSLVVLALVLLLIFPRRFIMEDIRGWQWRRERRARTRSSLEERREILRQAWAEDRIDTATFERRTDELLREEDAL